MSSKTAIITGAGSGIGRATAVRLSQLGYATVLIGRSEPTLRETERLVREALVIPTDITKPDAVEAAVTQTVDRFGRIDALINNAGVAPVKSIEETTPQLWHEIIDTNLSAVYYLCRAAWPVFKRQGEGVIVNLSSRSARDPFSGFLAYGAAKAALNNLGLSLAREGAVIGVRVHTIAPGAVETPMFRNILSTEQFPADNTLSPEEVAGIIGQCVTGELRYTSGEVIWVAKRP